MRKILVGTLALGVSSCLSYLLVVGVEMLPSMMAPASSPPNATLRASFVETRPPAEQFRIVSVWHREFGWEPATLKGARHETGIWYESSDGQFLSAVCTDFNSAQAAASALSEIRRSAVHQEEFDPGIASAGRYFPKYYVELGIGVLPRLSAGGSSRPPHAVVWAEGDRLVAVCGPTKSAVESLVVWCSARPFSG